MSQVQDYRFIKLDELYSLPLEIDWLIEGVIPTNSVGMIYGASGTGKSHIILSMAAMIANGQPWFDKETKQGSVLVMAGEGLSGLSRRLRAIEKEHNLDIDKGRLHISNRAIGLDTADGYKIVEQAISQLETPPQIIIIDTLSRHLMESGENSNDDMARFINRLEEIRLKYECTIILVHHTGKSAGQGARGASALKANVDFSFEVSGQDKKCAFSCDKMKDADDAIPVKHFEIKTIELGVVDSKGKQVTGACVVATTAPAVSSKPKQTKEDTALSCFNPDGKEWQKAYVEVCTDNVAEDTKRRQYRDARSKLVASGIIQENEDGTYSRIEAA